MRIDLYLKTLLHLSKQEIKSLLKSQVIKVNGQTITQPNYCFNLNNDQVTYQNKKLPKNPFTYIMLNKPKGYISANHDQNHATIMDLIATKYHHLNIVGRLDKDTTGLIILTDDLYAFKHLTMPKYHQEKEYLVEIEKKLSLDDVIKFNKGIVIDHDILLKPAKLEIVEPFLAKVIIKEGKYHQIKKMFLSIQNKVIELKRIRINRLYLDRNLTEGEYKLLNEEEIECLLNQLDLER